MQCNEHLYAPQVSCHRNAILQCYAYLIFHMYANSCKHGRRRCKSLLAMNISMLRRSPAVETQSCDATHLCIFHMCANSCKHGRRRCKSLRCNEHLCAPQVSSRQNAILQCCAFLPFHIQTPMRKRRRLYMKRQPYGFRRIAFRWRRRRDSNS